jgi:hypothetical protein
MEEMKARAVSTLNKKRYHEIAELLDGFQSLDRDTVLEVIRRVLKFDPTLKVCSPEEVRRKNMYTKQRAERQGISQYELRGRKYYEQGKTKQQQTKVA